METIRQRRINKISCIIAVLVGTLSTLTISSLIWLLHTWNDLSMEELVYHIKSPMTGASRDMVLDYIHSCIPVTLFVLFLLVFIIIKTKKNKKYNRIFIALAITLSFISLFGYGYYTWSTLGITTYIANQTSYSTFVDDHYVDPELVQLTFPEQKRNLIYIYLESMEITYSDLDSGGAFNENFIPELTKLANTYEDFSGSSTQINGAYSLTGSTWTIAAMFSQSSGLPLLIPIDDNSMSTQDSFLPAITDLGDVLEYAGYNQVLLLGSDANFAGRALLYSQHGNFDILDYSSAVNNNLIPEDYHVFWGYEDKKLFQFAKDTLTELASSDEPFNLTLLTVDTHFEDGYLCEDCPDTYGNNQYANVMACSSQKVYDFIHWIQRQDFYENTTIVICGDHPTMDTDFCQDIDSDYDRRVYTCIINSAVDPELEEGRIYSTFDMFPTTLASLGIDIEGDRLGLGTNLFSKEPTLTELYGINYENTELAKRSEFMDKITNDLNVRQYAMKTTVRVSASAYDRKTNSFTIHLKDVGEFTNISLIHYAVWSAEDQSDLIWYDITNELSQDYILEINLADYSNNKGDYQIHAYCTMDDGEYFMLCSTTVDIQ